MKYVLFVICGTFILGCAYPIASLAGGDPNYIQLACVLMYAVIIGFVVDRSDNLNPLSFIVLTVFLFAPGSIGLGIGHLITTLF